MSFFLDEPPPLDYEIPPPLDDKVRDDDNDFDLDDEIIIEDNISACLDLPELELPSDYKVFASASIDEDELEIPSPPELSPEPQSKCKDSNSKEEEVRSHCDVAEKKESEKNVDEGDESIACCAPVAEIEAVGSSRVDVGLVEEERIVIGERPEPEGSCEFDDFARHGDGEDETTTSRPERCEGEKQIENNANTIGDIEDEPFELNTGVDEHKTEQHLVNDVHHQNNKDIPEQINENVHVPELTTTLDFAQQSDDDFDDFNDFESAIPANRHVELVQQIDSKLSLSDEAVVFEADFSGFNAFGDSKDDFDDFQDFTSAVPASSAATSQQLAPQVSADDDDDDFGDFSDFKEAPPLPQPAAVYETSAFNSKILMKPSNLHETIDMMFPAPESSQSISDVAVEPRILKSDKFVSKFDDFDATVALGYQYTSSKASQILVKSLGIDTRNILVSAQWSSSSNVPRFAANLSFNPIEPLKPAEGGAVKPAELNPAVLLQPSKPPETVPQADFDWSSAGLVNPLDAHKSNYLLDLEQRRVAMANSDKINYSSSLNHAQPSNDDPTSLLTNQTTDIDELLRQFDSLNTRPTSNLSTHTSANSAPPAKPPIHQEEPAQQQQQLPAPSPADPHESANSLVDQAIKQAVETEAKAHASIKSDLNSNNSSSSDSFYQWSNSSNVARTIKLPETHIFTPEKGTSPVSREVVPRDLSPTPSPQPPSMIVNQQLAGDTPAPVFVREYRDIEYSLEPKRKTTGDFDADFDDFQSAEPVVPITSVPTIAVDPLATLVPTAAVILQPLKVAESEAPAKEGSINWPDPGIASQTTSELVEDFAFMDLGQAPTALQSQSDRAVSSLIESNTPPSTVIHTNSNFALNPTSSTVSQVNGVSHNASNDDDDDFDDFQAAAPVTAVAPVAEVKKPAAYDPITLSPAHLVSQTANTPTTWINSFDEAEVNRIEAAFPKCKVPMKVSQRKSSDDSDDWSDFVTAPAPLPPPHPSKANSNHHQHHHDDGDDWSMFVSMPPKLPSQSSTISSQKQPNFTSWNQPIKHQYVNHATSFLSNGTNNGFINSGDNNVPTNSMTITDNFNYHLQSFNNQQQQLQRPNGGGVSTILPDLDFAMPKHNMMMNNLSSSSSSRDMGKK